MQTAHSFPAKHAPGEKAAASYQREQPAFARIHARSCTRAHAHRLNIALRPCLQCPVARWLAGLFGALQVAEPAHDPGALNDVALLNVRQQVGPVGRVAEARIDSVQKVLAGRREVRVKQEPEELGRGRVVLELGARHAERAVALERQHGRRRAPTVLLDCRAPHRHLVPLDHDLERDGPGLGRARGNVPALVVLAGLHHEAVTALDPHVLVEALVHQVNKVAAGDWRVVPIDDHLDRGPIVQRALDVELAVVVVGALLHRELDLGAALEDRQIFVLLRDNNVEAGRNHELLEPREHGRRIRLGLERAVKCATLLDAALPVLLAQCDHGHAHLLVDVLQQLLACLLLVGPHTLEDGADAVAGDFPRLVRLASRRADSLDLDVLLRLLDLRLQLPHVFVRDRQAVAEKALGVLVDPAAGRRRSVLLAAAGRSRV
mmetsp:Transcript_108961/g.316763  ORF Transcript_108961/g.316763 Transcript_108961/m.316763 type:complete len:433 (-) Transcript_108961:287-1585(-)